MQPKAKKGGSMSENRLPELGEFFDPVPGSWNDSDGAKVRGEASIELRRCKTREFELLRHFGYRDPETGHTFVVPRDLDTFTANLSSAPVLVNWIVPVLGTHFNPILLHDGLVEDELYDPANPDAQGAGYFGPKVSREEADRIARDAMGHQGTGFIRRWLTWVGMMIGTILSPEGIVGPRTQDGGRTASAGSRTRHKVMLISFGLFYLIFGLYSIAEVVGLGWGVLPWLTSDNWFVRLVLGGIAAMLIPLVLALTWWRWSALLTVTLSEDLAYAGGADPRREQLVLTVALALVVAVAIKVVGVLLIAAMLIIPAAAARTFASTPERMAVAAMGVGAVSVLAGLQIALVADTPAGPTVICVAAGIFALSALARSARIA